MIPLRDQNPTRRFSVVTLSLIVINIAVFIADRFSQVTVAVPQPNGMYLQDTMGNYSLLYSLIPAYVTGQGHPLFPPPAVPPWATVLTSMFLHGGWLHLLGNMLYLWIFGNNIEDVLGRARFIAFYLACGVGAALLHIAGNPASPVPTVGASGAIAGVMGAYLLLYPRARILSLIPFVIAFFAEVPAFVVIGFWFVLQVFNSRFGGDQLTGSGSVAYLAHVGGFVTGLLLITLLGGRNLVPPDPAPYPTYEP